MADIRNASNALPKLGWLPDISPSGYPLDLDSSQKFTRPRQHVDPVPRPPAIGWITNIGPLMDVWQFNRGVTGAGNSFYLGGRNTQELGGFSFGLNARDPILPKLKG